MKEQKPTEQQQKRIDELSERINAIRQELDRLTLKKSRMTNDLWELLYEAYDLDGEFDYTYDTGTKEVRKT